MNFETASALSAAALLQRIVTLCDQNGAVDQSVKSIRAPLHDPGLVLAMCGTCGGVIDDFNNEIVEFNNGENESASGSQALLDEIQELRAKERGFDATKLRIRNLEEREAAVQRREELFEEEDNRVGGTENKHAQTLAAMQAKLDDAAQKLGEREALIELREAQLQEDRQEVHTLREQLLSEKQRLRRASEDQGSAATPSTKGNSNVAAAAAEAESATKKALDAALNECREFKLKSSMLEQQLQRQQEEHNEEKEDLLAELQTAQAKAKAPPPPRDAVPSSSVPAAAISPSGGCGAPLRRPTTPPTRGDDDDEDDDDEDIETDEDEELSLAPVVPIKAANKEAAAPAPPRAPAVPAGAKPQQAHAEKTMPKGYAAGGLKQHQQQQTAKVQQQLPAKQQQAGNSSGATATKTLPAPSPAKKSTTNKLASYSSSMGASQPVVVRSTPVSAITAAALAAAHRSNVSAAAAAATAASSNSAAGGGGVSAAGAGSKKESPADKLHPASDRASNASGHSNSTPTSANNPPVALTARERRELALKKHADRLKAVRGAKKS